jgi:hypothetical protein
MWTGFIWLRIGTRIIGFHKILGTFQIAEQLLASQEELSFIELVSYEISLSYQGAKLYFCSYKQSPSVQDHLGYDAMQLVT